MAQQCPRCFNESEDWRPFCKHCSAPLTAEAAASSTLAPPTDSRATDPATSDTSSMPELPPNQPGVQLAPWGGQAPALPAPHAPSSQQYGENTYGQPNPAAGEPSGQWVPPNAPPIAYARPTAQKASAGAKAAVAIAICTVLAAGGGMTYLALRSKPSPYPKAWDPKVQPLADAAARIRGLRFLHPVKVKFYTEADFVKLVDGSDDQKPDTKAKAKTRQYEGVLRALGVIEGNLDLEKSSNQLDAAGILAFYDPDTKAMSIRGTDLTVDVRVTLVHELTHALQDQYFDLNRIQQQSKDAKSSASKGLIEGDASWVENAYLKELTKAERRDYDKANEHVSKNVGTKTKEVPDFLRLSKAAPYAFGESFVALLRTDGGQAAVDAAFRAPPMAEHLIIDPVRFIDHTKPKSLDDPKLPTGATDIQHNGEFGTLSWLLMLAERVGSHLVLNSLNGWAGDAFTVFRSANGSNCAALQFASTNAAASQSMRSAIAAWKAKMPASANIAVHEDENNPGAIAVFTCDPGTKPKLVTHRARGAYQLLQTRNGIVSEVATARDKANRDIRVHFVRCFADKIVNAYTAKQLDNDALIGSAAYQSNLRTWSLDCQSSTSGQDKSA